jgi:hypothetical protein
VNAVKENELFTKLVTEIGSLGERGRIPAHRTLARKEIALFTKLVPEIGSFKTGVP